MAQLYPIYIYIHYILYIVYIYMYTYIYIYHILYIYIYIPKSVEIDTLPNFRHWQIGFVTRLEFSTLRSLQDFHRPIVTRSLCVGWFRTSSNYRTFMYIYIYTHRYIYIYIHTYMHAYIHTYIYIHTYAIRQVACVHSLFDIQDKFDSTMCKTLRCPQLEPLHAFLMSKS